MAPYPTGRRPPAPDPNRCVACGAPPDPTATRGRRPVCRPCAERSAFAAGVIVGVIERLVARGRSDAAAASAAAERAAEG